MLRRGAIAYVDISMKVSFIIIQWTKQQYQVH